MEMHGVSTTTTPMDETTLDTIMTRIRSNQFDLQSSDVNDSLIINGFNVTKREFYLLFFTEDGIPKTGHFIPGLMVSWPMQIFVIVLYTMTAVTALTGNAISVHCLWRGKQSASKVELKLYLINLAVSDMLMAIFSIPFTFTEFMYTRFLFPLWLCPVVRSVQLLAVHVSVYTLAAIGIDRFFAMVYPLRSLGQLSEYRPWIMGGVWMSGGALFLLQFTHCKVDTRFHTKLNETMYICGEDWTEIQGKVYTMSIFGITFLGPLIVLCLSYGSIGYKMLRRELPGQNEIGPELDENQPGQTSGIEMATLSDHSQDSAIAQEAARNHRATSRGSTVIREQLERQTLMMRERRFRVLQMLFVVVVAFVLSWLPIQSFNIAVWMWPSVLDFSTMAARRWFVFGYLVCHWLSMANSCVNPIIYCFMSDNMREDMKELVCRCCRLCRLKKGSMSIREHLAEGNRSGSGRFKPGNSVKSIKSESRTHSSICRKESPRNKKMDTIVELSHSNCRSASSHAQV